MSAARGAAARGVGLSEPQRYVYRGDRHTAPEWRGRQCAAVLRPDGKCIRGRNGNMLVEFVPGGRVVVNARRLLRLRAESAGAAERGAAGAGR